MNDFVDIWLHWIENTFNFANKMSEENSTLYTWLYEIKKRTYFILYICSLFEDACSNYDYTEQNIVIVCK